MTITAVRIPMRIFLFLLKNSSVLETALTTASAFSDFLFTCDIVMFFNIYPIFSGSDSPRPVFGAVRPI